MILVGTYWCGAMQIWHGVVRLRSVVNSTTQICTIQNLHQPVLYCTNEVLSKLPYFAVRVVDTTYNIHTEHHLHGKELFV